MGVQRNTTTVMWTIVLFLGATLLFRTLREATEGSSTLVTVLVQVGALVVLVGAVVLIMRRLR